MNKCEFYISEGCTIQNFPALAAGIIADIHRRFHSRYGRTLVICSDPSVLSKEIWKVPGFIPGVTADDPGADVAPVVVAKRWISGFEIIVNTNLNNVSYSSDELSCSVLADFSLKSDSDILPACRSRYRQLKNCGIQPEPISIP